MPILGPRVVVFVAAVGGVTLAVVAVAIAVVSGALVVGGVSPSVVVMFVTSSAFGAVSVPFTDKCIKLRFSV